MKLPGSTRSGLLGIRPPVKLACRATDGLPSAADAPLQRSELAKSAIFGLSQCDRKL